MKLMPLLAVITFTLLASVSVRAATYSYPSEKDAWFTLEISDAWHPKVTDGTLEASAPKDAAYVAFWVLKDEVDFKNLEKDLDEVLKDSVIEPKVGEPAVKKINGIEFTRFVGTGKDRKEKTPVTFEVWMFAPKEGKAGVLYFDYDSDATPDMIKSLAAMIDSIKLKK
ncbi:MAG: hypothetical protein ABJF10_11750 [Chthoniobacter sp.]|uniref:hypothetical protein n=1 Tax=Chthoniobacter sp. TaxID=2510640 RepID=UPI0032AC9AA8